MNYTKRNVLITGGSGYIGSCLAAYLSKSYLVTTLDIKNKSIFNSKKIKHFKVNLNNKKKVANILREIKPKYVIHLAGQSTIDMVNKKKNLYYQNNFLATKNLIEIIERLKIPNLIFSSTAAVYKKKKTKINEKSKIFSNNMYGKSKIKCEDLIKKIDTNVTKYCILRFFNVSSSLVKQKIGEFHSPETHLIPIVINSIFLKKKIHIYGNKYSTRDGTCNRDYVHILDILFGIKKSIQYLSKENNKSEIFNFGSGKYYSVSQIIKYSLDLTKLKTKIVIKKLRKYDTSHLNCDINKAKKILKWTPKYSNLKKIIKDEIWWFRYLSKKNLKRKFIY